MKPRKRRRVAALTLTLGRVPGRITLTRYRITDPPDSINEPNVSINDGSVSISEP